MRLEDVQVAIGVVVADGEPHASLLLPILVERDSDLQTSLGERAIAIVAEQEAGRGVAGDVNIRPAVTIEIGGDGGERIIRRGCQNAGWLAHIDECSVSVVVVQTASLLRKSPGPTEDRNTRPIAGGILAANRDLVRIENHIMTDEEIEATVAIIVDPGAAGAIADPRMQ